MTVSVLFGPLAAAGQIIKTRSTAGMPLPPLILTLISSIVWFCYGLYIYEIPVMIPNGLGIIFGIMQISLFAWATQQEKKRGADAVVMDDGFEPISSQDEPSFLREDDPTSAPSILRAETPPIGEQA
jgi:uncharacterized protein with PQ loop repeat